MELQLLSQSLVLFFYFIFLLSIKHNLTLYRNEQFPWSLKQKLILNEMIKLVVFGDAKFQRKMTEIHKLLQMELYISMKRQGKNGRNAGMFSVVKFCF